MRSFWLWQGNSAAARSTIVWRKDDQNAVSCRVYANSVLLCMVMRSFWLWHGTSAAARSTIAVEDTGGIASCSHIACTVLSLDDTWRPLNLSALCAGHDCWMRRSVVVSRLHNWRSIPCDAKPGWRWPLTAAATGATAGCSDGSGAALSCQGCTASAASCALESSSSAPL